MSGTQGRYPPAMPPEASRRPLADGAPAYPHTQPPRQGQPGQGHPSQGQPAQGQGNWPPMPPAHAPQPPTFPRFPQQPSAPAYPDAAQSSWSPAPPATFPPLPSQHAAHRPPAGPPPVPQAQPPAYGYPPQYQADMPRTEPPRQRMPDPSSYDLGSYGLPGQSGQAAHPGLHVPPTGRDGRTQPPSAPQWPPQHQPDPYGHQAQPQHQHGSPQGSAQPAYPAGAMYQPPQNSQQHAGQQHAGQQHAGQQHAGQQAGEYQAEYQDDIELDEPPRKRRRWLVAAALVGSIGIGSGMAYGYKMFLGPKGGEKSQVVRASREPVKVTPGERGGKQFPNANSQVQNSGRLPSEGSAVAAGGETSSGFTDSNGVRRVPTVAVGPGPSAVPGMTIVGPGSGPGATLPPAAMEPPRQGPVATAPPAAPTRTVNAMPPATPSRQAVSNALPPDAAAAAAVPRQRVAAVDPTKAVAAEPVARPKAVSGYVAVLGFQKSQLEAMKMMADLQQKYEALRDKKLDIVQSDQTSRGLGTIYRVVVGPRGGISPVREVCNQLYQAGMPKQGCYPLAE